MYSYYRVFTDSELSIYGLDFSFNSTAQYKEFINWAKDILAGTDYVIQEPTPVFGDSNKRFKSVMMVFNNEYDATFFMTACNMTHR